MTGIGSLICAALFALSDTTVTIHRVEADVVPSGIIQTNNYLREGGPSGEPMRTSTTLRLKYTQMQGGQPSKVGAYHGIGVGCFLINEHLGNPLTAYLVQGAPLVNLSRTVSLNYELNLGLSMGWNAYDGVNNRDNHVLGSRTNCYIGADVYFRVRLGHHWDANIGYGYAHFSNANLKMPNEGMHTMGGRLSLAYYIHRDERESRASLLTAPTMHKGWHWMTDLLFYGGAKKKSLQNPEMYWLGGFSVSPMYRLNEAFAMGPSLDGVYDNSVESPLALGAQARAELTMPVFRASGGVGYYFLGGMKCVYETLAFKIDVTRHLFLNIGYCFYNYNYTNNLMLGIGYRLGS